MLGAWRRDLSFDSYISIVHRSMNLHALDMKLNVLYKCVIYPIK